MIVRPSVMGTAAARRTVAEPPHTPLGVIHTLRSPPARPSRRPETRKIDIDDDERFGEGAFDNHRGRTDAGGRSDQLCEAAPRHKWQSEGWSTQARGGLKGGGHPYHSAICEGWPMSVSMAVCVLPSRQLIRKVWLHAVRMARARGGAPLGSCAICDLSPDRREQVGDR